MLHVSKYLIFNNENVAFTTQNKADCPSVNKGKYEVNAANTKSRKRLTILVNYKECN